MYSKLCGHFRRIPFLMAQFTAKKRARCMVRCSSPASKKSLPGRGPQLPNFTELELLHQPFMDIYGINMHSVSSKRLLTAVVFSMGLRPSNCGDFGASSRSGSFSKSKDTCSDAVTWTRLARERQNRWEGREVLNHCGLYIYVENVHIYNILYNIYNIYIYNMYICICI